MKLLIALITLMLSSCKMYDSDGIRRGYKAMDSTHVYNGTTIQSVYYIKK